MAIKIPIISDFQDAGIKQAKKAFGDFKTAVGNAETGMGKFKAGSKVAMDQVSANAGNLAMMAGTAIAGFAIKAIGDFQAVALEAGKFAEATGLAVEDASRYMEVAGDIGIPVDNVEQAIGRLNRTIGADPDKVRNLGVDLVYLKDGSLDVNETFLNTIERIKEIKDPAEKARVAAQLLGKGWQGMSELIGMGADDLRRSLDGVSESKVIDKDELQKARDFRDAMDELKGVSEDLALQIGEALIPALTDLADVIPIFTGVKDALLKIPGASWLHEHFGFFPVIQATKDIFNGLGDAVGFVTGQFKDQEPDLAMAYYGYEKAKTELKKLKDEVEDTSDNALKPFNVILNDSWKEIRNIDQAWKDLTGSLETVVAIDEAKASIDLLTEAAAKAFATGAQEDVANYNAQLLDTTTKIGNIATEMDDISASKIKVLVDTGDLEGAVALIEKIKAFQKKYANVSDPYALLAGAGVTLPPGLDFSGFAARAGGGPVAGGSSYLVGERGPELFTPTMGGNITPNGALGGGGGTINITVTSADPNEVVRALQTYNRNVGKLPVSVQ